MALSSVVTRLRPKPHAFSELTDAYSSGSFEFCIEALQHDDSPQAIALAARTLIRLNRLHEAVALIEHATSSGREFSHLELGELLTQQCAAKSRLGYNDVESLFAEARVSVLASASNGLEAEYLSRQAYAHLMLGDLQAAESAALLVLEIVPGFKEPDYFSPIEHSRARAFDVLAFVSARRERYDLQRGYLQAALHEFDRTLVRDDVFEAKLLANLSIFAIDFGDDGYVRERFNRLPDSPWLAGQRYEILRSLAWSSALRGDNLGAFRDLREAIDTADTIPKKMRAALDRAYFARQLKQELTAREELDYAERLSTRVDWNAVASDEGELTALAFLSQEIASTVPFRARRLFDRYKALKKKLPPDFLATCDRRARAEELGIDATIAQAEGARNRAAELFLEAFNIWDSLGYGVRAALVARNLVELRSDSQFSEYLLREAKLRPRSWLAASLQHL
jgi:hypothetical protein